MVNLAAPNVQDGPSFFAENRAWLRSPHGTDDNMKINATLDADSFEAVLVKERYIPSGVTVMRITSGDKKGLIALNDGSGEPVGLLFNTVSIDGLGADRRVFNAILVHGAVTESRLPVKSGPGALDDAAKKALPHIVAYK